MQHIAQDTPSFSWIVVIVLNFRFKELRFGLHADSIIFSWIEYVKSSSKYVPNISLSKLNETVSINCSP